MSARQRQRLQQQLKQLDEPAQEESDGSEESDEEDDGLIVRRGFGGLAALSDSSEDQSSSDEEQESEEDVVESSDANGEPSGKDEEEDLAAEEEENLLLEKAIEEAAASELSRSEAGPAYSVLFGVDKNTLLDVDVFISRRFGKYQNAMAEGNVAGAGGAGNASKRRGGGGGRGAPARKSIFGFKEEWPKPPSFIGGGLGQKLVDGRYVFEESKEWKKTGSLFRIVREFGDINRAILFLLYCNEVHPESLLMLSKTFAVYGRMDRALDMVRRALYTYECASLTSFFSAEVLGRDPYAANNDSCVLDWRVVENAPLFTALYRYVHLVGMQGYHALARDAARVLLSLSQDDPTMVLLALDHYLVACNDKESRNILLTFMGISGLELSHDEGANEPTVAIEWVGGSGPDKGEGTAAFPLLDLDATTSEDTSAGSNSVMHLGGWWLSLALIEEQRAKSAAEGAEMPADLALATAVTSEALVRFPFMLQPLLGSLAEDLATSTKARFEEVLQQAPFSDGEDEGLGESERKLFAKLGHVYSVRNKTMWQQRVALLLAGAERAAERLAREDGPGRHDYYYLQCPRGAALLKYSEANPEHYAEEIPQFPQEANPLDPQLEDYERLLEPVQLAQQRAHMRRVAAEAFPGAGGYEELVQTQLIQGLQQQVGGFGAGVEQGLWEDEQEVAMAMQIEAQQAQQRAAGAVAAVEEDRARAEREEEEKEEEDGGDGEGNEDDELRPPTVAPVPVARQDLQEGAFARPVSANVERRFREAPQLDYTAPLMQLLLQSFFCPWYRL